MREQSPGMTGANWGLLILLSVLWGGSFFFTKVALADVPPLTLVLARVAIAAIMLHLVLYFSGRRFPLDRRHLGLFAIMGLTNNAIPFTLLFWGQTQIASGLAAILNAMTPISTIIILHFLTRDEKLSVNKSIGVVLGVLGVTAMIGPSALSGFGLHVVAELACLGATISYSFAVFFGKWLKGTDPIIVATGQLTASSIIMLPFTLFIDRPWILAVPGLEAAASVLALAVLSTALAYILYFHILATSGGTNVSLVTLLVPVSAIALGSIVLGERLQLTAFLGMALIAVGLIAIDGRLWHRRRRRQRRSAG